MGNVDVVRGMYEAFGRGDVENVLAACDPRIEWRQAEGNPLEGEGGALTGPDEVMEKVFTRLGQEWDPFIVTPRQFHDAGDSVITEGRYTGAYRATGRSIDAQFCHVFELRNGKVTRFQQYMDTAQMQQVMGARLEPQGATQS